MPRLVVTILLILLTSFDAAFVKETIYYEHCDKCLVDTNSSSSSDNRQSHECHTNHCHPKNATFPIIEGHRVDFFAQPSRPVQIGQSDHPPTLSIHLDIFRPPRA